ncbi:hypothetical protein ACVWXQ_000016 [Bradyrhizobium sp. S3.14.4]
MLCRLRFKSHDGHSISAAIDIGKGNAALGFALIIEKELGPGIYGSVPAPGPQEC